MWMGREVWVLASRPSGAGGAIGTCSRRSRRHFSALSGEGQSELWESGVVLGTITEWRPRRRPEMF